MGQPRIWVLLGRRRGDNNQALALAEAIGLPYETKALRYNPLRLLPKRLLGASLAVLSADSRRGVSGPPPDLVIAVGHRSVPVVRALKRRSGGRMRAVHLGNPRVPAKHFDLVVTTPQYPVPGGPNVICNPVTLGAPAGEAQPPSPQFAKPMRLLLLGGPTTFWRIEGQQVKHALATLAAKARRDGGSVVILGSPRTPRALLEEVKRQAAALDPPAHFVSGSPTYGQLLAAADQLFVTGDSVSMVSEALATGKPVGIVPVRATLPGKAWMALFDRLRPGVAIFPRDLRRFWAEIGRRGFAGTVERPLAGDMPDVVGDTARQARALLGLAPGA